MASVAIMKAFVMLHILAGFMPVLRGVYLLHHLVDLDGVDLVRLSSHSSHCNLFCMPSHATCVMMSVSYFTCCSVLVTALVPSLTGNFTWKMQPHSSPDFLVGVLLVYFNIVLLVWQTVYYST